MLSSSQISKNREWVCNSYGAADFEYCEKNTGEYIFPNQKEDAINIVDKFYKNKRRVISIQKKTKVGADGLMIEIAKLLTTHNDDKFVVDPKKVRILTGMSNASWEKDMKDKAPSCFEDKIFHHGKLKNAKLEQIRNGLIIIDEIDTGDKENQVLHTTLKDAGLLDVNNMEEHNNRFVFISATMIKEKYDLFRWGDLHEEHEMSIPSLYFGHKDFLERGIVKEFYSLSSKEKAEEWVQEDIIDNYGTDYRVHLVRVTAKNVNLVKNACILKGVTFRNHNSKDLVPEKEKKQFFEEPLTNHIVLAVKAFFRRANLIPNRWKLRIGAIHELYTKSVDNNVQIQGLIGRMSGYWRTDIEGGHKTGPYRTSIKAIQEYEKTYVDPFGINTYQTAGFIKTKGKVSAAATMLSPKNIKNLEAVDLPVVQDTTDPATVPIVFSITPAEYGSIKRNGNKWDYSTILPIIRRYKKDILPELERIEKADGKDQIVEPDTEATTYKVYITDFVHAFTNNKKHTHVGNIKDKQKDTFQIYLDKVEHRIIISFKYGTKTITTPKSPES